jgi:hypothetical protein
MSVIDKYLITLFLTIFLWVCLCVCLIFHDISSGKKTQLDVPTMNIKEAHDQIYISFRSNDFWPSYGPWTLKFGQIFSCHHFVSLCLEILTWFLVWECIIISYRSTLKFIPVEWFLANLQPKIIGPKRNVNLICYHYIPTYQISKSISQSIAKKSGHNCFISELRTWAVFVLDRILVYSVFGLDRILVYSVFSFDRILVYSKFDLDRFYCNIKSFMYSSFITKRSVV